MVGGFVAMGVIIVSLIFGFNLGTLFAGAMAIFASVAILYNTSNIIHHHRTDQYVGAALSLFAGVALLFWYILRIFMNRDSARRPAQRHAAMRHLPRSKGEKRSTASCPTGDPAGGAGPFFSTIA